MRYKILIVDDEPLIREGIRKKLDESIVRSSEIYMACDGFEALEKARTIHPDIIITDIKMPEMDGIELISKIYEMKQTPECIIISGYSDFEYAKSAIKLGVKGYILKPVDAVELNKAIDELIKECNKKEADQVFQHMNYTYDELLRMRKKDIKYTEALFNQEDKGVVRDFFEEKDKNRYVIGVLKIEQYNLVELGFKDIENGLFEYAIRNILQEICTQFLWFKNTLCENEYVLLTNKEVPFMRVKLLEAIDHLQALLHITCIGGIGLHHEMNKIELSYIQAKQSINERFLRGMEKLYLYKEVKNTISAIGNEKIYHSKIFIAHLENENIKEIIKYIEQIFEKVIEDDTVKYYDFRYIIMDIYLRIKEFSIRRSKKAHQEWSNLNYFTKEFGEYKDISVIKQELIGMLKEVFNHIGEIKTGAQIVEVVLKKIDEEYQRDFSLALVSSQYHINSDYFCRIFKENTGYNFSDYITKVRMERAIELLNTTHFKIAKIASMVGFEDSKYFSKVFKKERGISPRDYLKEREQYEKR